MNEKRKYEIKRAVDTAFMVIFVILLAVIAWILLGAIVEAQGPYPYVTWGRGSAPWYHYAPSYKVRAACFNNYGAHVPCQAVTYTVWR